MPDSVDSTLPDDLETFRRLGHLAVNMATDYLAQIRQRPVFLPMTPDERQELLSMALSQEGDTTLRNQFALRACILHDGTTEEDVEALLNCVRCAGEALRKQADTSATR